MVNKRTKTTEYLLPCLKIGSKRLKELGFINAYLLDAMSDEGMHDGCIYLLFKPENNIQMGGWIESMGSRVVDDYEYDGGYLVVVVRIGGEFMGDYELFMESKYSKLSERLKQLIPPDPRENEKQCGYVCSVPFAAIHAKKDVPLMITDVTAIVASGQSLEACQPGEVVEKNGRWIWTYTLRQVIEAEYGVTVALGQELVSAIDTEKESITEELLESLRNPIENV